jgi:hypothetical protein
MAEIKSSLSRFGGRKVLRHYQTMLRAAERKELAAKTEGERRAAGSTISIYHKLISDWHNSNKPGGEEGPLA